MYIGIHTDDVVDKKGTENLFSFPRRLVTNTYMLKSPFFYSKKGKKKMNSLKIKQHINPNSETRFQ